MNIKLSSQPKFSYMDIKSTVSPATFQKAKNLFESGAVKNFETRGRGYTAQVVSGSNKYRVSLSRSDVMNADCNCYAGENGYICKHVLAVGLKALDYFLLPAEDLLAPKNLSEVKQLVNLGMRKIKAYVGPSKYWDKYVHSLDTGAMIIVESIQNLEATKENVKYLWQLVLRLSKKLSQGGVDDSDGIVGGCVDKIIRKIIDMVRKNKELIKLLHSFTDDYTGFGFEEDLDYYIKTLKR